MIYQIWPQMLNKLFHKISHLLKWNYGTVESFWDGDILMIGFRCTCGELQNVHPSVTNRTFK